MITFLHNWLFLSVLAVLLGFLSAIPAGVVCVSYRFTGTREIPLSTEIWFKFSFWLVIAGVVSFLLFGITNTFYAAISRWLEGR